MTKQIILSNSLKTATVLLYQELLTAASPQLHLETCSLMTVVSFHDFFLRCIFAEDEFHLSIPFLLVCIFLAILFLRHMPQQLLVSYS